MSMTGISNSYNNYVTQNTNDTTKKNVAKSNSRQVEFKEFNSEIKEPKLSTVAKNVLDEIRKTYGDMDIMVYEDGKDAKELLSRSTKEFTVMFSAEELEKMASGEKYKKQQINGIQGAVRMSEAINENMDMSEPLESRIMMLLFLKLPFRSMKMVLLQCLLNWRKCQNSREII